jgi:hypothetical protein
VDENVAGADLPFVIEQIDPGLMKVLRENPNPLLIGMGVRYEGVSIVCHGCTLRLDRASFNDPRHYLSELDQGKMTCVRPR